MRRGGRPTKARAEVRPPGPRPSRAGTTVPRHVLESRLAGALERQAATAEILRAISSLGGRRRTGREAARRPCLRQPRSAERGETHYRQALALAEPRSMRPLVAHCYLGLGRLYRRAGRREEAQEYLTTATAMYGDMGMTYWREQDVTGPLPQILRTNLGRSPAQATRSLATTRGSGSTPSPGPWGTARRPATGSMAAPSGFSAKSQ
jgi:tetratricopeptide (TPR) repeat protein